MNRNVFLDVYRIVLTIFVLLFHLDICKSGFLAVCGFFTISGYLFALNIDKDDFNIKNYYLSRLKALYLPLVIVCFTTVFVFRYIIDIPWLSIKQETFSVLFSYNNYFQISANKNYFIRTDASPFTHMWYISILIQIEFVLPIIVCLFRKFKIKISNVVLYTLTCISIIYFIFIDNKYGLSYSYYDTFSRIFSFLIGVSVYRVEYNNSNKYFLSVSFIIIFLLFFSNDLANKYYVFLMILVSIFSGLIIVFTKNINFNEHNRIKKLSEISYYIYLTQYPIIYILNSCLNYNKTTMIFIEIILIVLISLIYDSGFGKNNYKLKKAVQSIIIIIALIGCFAFVTCPDYSKEIDNLKKQLEYNQSVLENKQKEYLDNMRKQHDVITNDVAHIDELIKNIDDTTKNASITFIGDSIMLGGSFYLDEYFSNYYCDAKGSRNGFLAYETLSDLLDKNVVGDYVVIHLGTNSGLELEEVENIASLIPDKKVLWLTVTNGWGKSQNPMLKEYCDKHENNYLADWYEFSLNHREYFGPDGLHLSDDGRHIYDKFIFDNLKPIINEDLLNKKNEIIKEYEKINDKSVSFYGNDLLISVYRRLDGNYLCYADSNYDYDTLYNQISDNINKSTITNSIVILLDSSLFISDDEIDELYELLKDRQLYVFAYNHKVKDLNDLLDKECYMKDNVHLNEAGNTILLKEINKILNK